MVRRKAVKVRFGSKADTCAILAKSSETPADLPQPASYAFRMDNDREAYEFSYALYLARQVDREAAQMIVRAAEEGLIRIEQATEALTRLSGQATDSSALQ